MIHRGFVYLLFHVIITTLFVWSTTRFNFRAPLFLIYIDISKVSLSERSQVVLYADDMLLYHPISICYSDDYSTLKSYKVN